LTARHPTSLSLACLVLAASVLVTRAEGAVVCSASDVCAATANPCTIAGTRDVASGCHLDFGTRAVVVTGTLQSALTGGSFALSAGTVNLTGGRIRSVGSTGAAGGNVTLSVAGALVMSGSGPTLDVGGAAGGGILSVTAGSIDVRAGSVEADGTGSEACGGAITLRATSGPLLLAAPVHATGHFLCAGGQLDLSGQRVEISASLNVSGGDYPGGIVVTADAGDILVASTATIRASGEQIELGDGGDGGPIALLGEAGNVTDGATPEGEAGSIVIVAAGTLEIAATLSAQGNGGGSNGGSIEIDAGGDATFAAHVRASGGGDAAGGEIDVRSDGVVTVTGGKSMQANGGYFGGGAITLRDATSIVVAGTLEARGSTGGNGGFTTLESCRASIEGALDTSAGGGGLSGANAITAGVITVPSAGRVVAAPCNPLIGTSCNILTLAAGTPTIDPLAVVTPAPTLLLDPLLNMCCGNTSLEPGESCDDGNSAACDGCSHLCQVESTPPCPSDGNECTADCTPGGGCTYQPRTGESCSDDGNLCTADVCNAFALCKHPVRVCNDGVACTIDSCATGIGCVATPDDGRCDDDESCTDESCDAEAGCLSASKPNGSTCSDGDACTTEDACTAGTCAPQGPALRCDDDDSCTTDSCLAALGCHYQENPAACPCAAQAGPLPAGSACADGNDCSQDDRCDGAGQCLPGAVCPDDGDACTLEMCLPVQAGKEICLAIDNQCVTSCAAQSNGTPCSDGSACTTGTCQGGACVALPVPCGDGDRCTGADYCLDAIGCRSGAPPIDEPLCELPAATLDHFVCYRAKTSKGTPRLQPVAGLPAADQFGTALADLRKTERLCLPSSVNGGDPGAAAHPDTLASYLVRLHDTLPSGAPRSNLEIVNQLGTIRVDLKKIDGVLLPSALSMSTPPGPPIPPDPDRFGCYKVAISQGTAKFLPVFGVTIEDQLGTLTVDVARPTRLCSPLDLDGQDPGAVGHAPRLLCYQVRTSSGSTRFVKRSGLLLGNELGSEQLDASALDELCVPSIIVAP